MNKISRFADQCVFYNFNEINDADVSTPERVFYKA